MPFTAAISGSIMEVMNPQAKNRLVTVMNAAVAPPARLVTIPAPFSLVARRLRGHAARRARGRSDEAEDAAGREAVGAHGAAAAVRRHRRPQDRRDLVRGPRRTAAAGQIYLHQREAVRP